MRYIEKMNTGEYIITERGINELTYHHVADFRGHGNSARI
jgi:predicted transcriptional regulator